MVKRISVFLISLVYFCSFASLAFGESYSYTYPDYVDIAGGAFIEVQSSLGSGSFVFPCECKNDTFSFSGSSGYNLCNVSDSTVYGYFITSTGDTYSVRSESLDVIKYEYEYEENNRTQTKWVDIEVTSISATNVNLIDYQADRSTDFQYYDFSYKEKFYIVLFVLAVFLSLCCSVLIVKRCKD